MPHVIIYAESVNLGKGPTYVANDDIILLDYLSAQPTNQSNSDSIVNDSPTVVLDKLERRGYRVVAMASHNDKQIGTDTPATYVWTLHKPEEIEPFV